MSKSGFSFIALVFMFNCLIGQNKDSLKIIEEKNLEIEKTVLDPIPSASGDVIVQQINKYIDAYEALPEVGLSNKSFEKIIKPLFSKAVGNSEGIVKNGSALSYVLDKDKSTLSINHAVFIKKCPGTIFNMNFNGTSEGSFLNVVNSTKYNYGLDASFKFSSRLTSSIFRKKEDTEELKEARTKKLYSEMLMTYQLLTITKTEKFKEIIKNLEDSISRANIIKNTPDYKKFRKFSDSLKVLTDSVKAVESFMKLYTTNILKDTIQEKISNFEKSNAKINAYSLHWLDYGLGYKLLNNAIFDSTIYTLYKVNQKQFNRVTLTLGYNYYRTGPKLLLFFNGGVKLFNSYALENQTLATINITDTTGIQEYSYRAYNNLLNKDLNTAYLTVNPFVTVLCFPFKSKDFGFEMATELKMQDSFNKRADEEKGKRYANPIMDGRVGLVYSIIDKDDKDKSRTTVGLFLTLTKYDMCLPKIGDFMGFGFRVGLPFNEIFKEKEKK
jgi:hypothetical protein